MSRDPQRAGAGRLLPWVLAAASTAGTLLVAEALLRVWRPDAQKIFLTQSLRESERGKFCDYDPTLGWAGKPNVDDTFDFVDCRHRVRQNAYGFRGPAVDFARTAARRIVVLGDSFVWGFCVEDDEVFTARLARESAAPLEVVNLGVSGYGTDQELLLWHHFGRRFQPDVVLLVVTPYTDLSDIRFGERYDHPKPFFVWDETRGLGLENVPVPQHTDRPWYFEDTTETNVPPAWLPKLAWRSALVSNTLLALARVPRAREALERAGVIFPRFAGPPWEDQLFVEPPTADMHAGWELLGRLLSTLADSVRQAGAELAVVIVPTPAQVYPELWPELARAHPPPAGHRLDRDVPRRRLTQLCHERHLRVIDLQPALEEAGRRDPYLYYRWNLHWTAAGHRVVAEVLQREVGQP